MLSAPPAAATAPSAPASTTHAEQDAPVAPGVVPPGFRTMSEGKATVLYAAENEVFYNKVQCFNRDMSIVMISLFMQTRAKELLDKENKKRERVQQAAASSSSEKAIEVTEETKQETPKFTVLEALSASGLRSLRYWHELPRQHLHSITVNDIDPHAVQAIRRSVQFNGASELLIPNLGDACDVMYQHRAKEKQFDIVDVDPYGSASMFLDGAVQAVADGGMLLVTCTDKSVLCGNNCETGWAKYGCMPLKGCFVHEQAMRVLLTALQTSASKYKRYIVPVLSFSVDYYVRCFVRVYESPLNVKLAASNLSYVYQCVSCGSHTFQPVGKVTTEGRSTKYTVGRGPCVDQNCRECGKAQRMGGPLWHQPTHDKEWVQRALDFVKARPGAFETEDRLKAVLSLMHDELPHAPLFYTLPSLCQILKMSPPQVVHVRAALINGGYKVSQAHCDPLALKTDAPVSVLWDILKTELQKRPGKALPEGSAGAAILAKPIQFQPDFKMVQGAAIRKLEVARFPENPEPNWGPKARASKRPAGQSEEYEKRKANQGKRRRLNKPCTFFASTGSCKFGDKCKYSHAPAGGGVAVNGGDVAAEMDESGEGAEGEEAKE